MSRRLRVALDVTPAVRETGGIGRYARELARALVARDRHDYVPLLLDRRRAGRPGAPGAGVLGGAGPPVRALGLPARWLTILWHRLRLPVPLELWTGRLDVVHGPGFLAPPTWTGRSVITVHDLSFLTHPDRADPALARHLARAVPRAVRGASHVLADSANTRDDLVRLLGVRAPGVTVAYPGVGPAFRRVADPAALDETRARYALDRPFVLGVGTLEPRKDWPTLIEAFVRLRGGAAAGRTLAIAGGEGWRTEGIHAAAARARAGGADVRLLGFVPDADLPALYSLCDAFAYPSRYEGFGLPPLEAMACGAPCVVSDGPCLPEVVGDAALVAPAGDPAALAEALARALGDGALRARLAAAGPRRAARYTWDACAAAVEGAYRGAAS